MRDKMVRRKAFFFDLLKGGINDEAALSNCPSAYLGLLTPGAGGGVTFPKKKKPVSRSEK